MTTDDAKFRWPYDRTPGGPTPPAETPPSEGVAELWGFTLLSLISTGIIAAVGVSAWLYVH